MSGSGLLSCFWYRHFPASEYVLVDIADDMLHIARKRFAGIDNVSYLVADYSREIPAKILMSLFRRCRYTIWKTRIRRFCLKGFATNCRREGCL